MDFSLFRLPSLPHFPTSLPLCPFLLLFLLSNPPIFASDSAAFPASSCRNIQQACAAQLFFFPPLPSVQETVPDVPLEQRLEEEEEEEGSGEGAGAVDAGGGWHFVPMSGPLSFPLYDEFVPTTPSYDYNAEPLEMRQVDICACPENDQCSFDTESTVKFSPQIRVAFCRPLAEVFKSKCKGARSLARVIGTLDRQKFDSFSGVNDTVIFCRCESERWSRVMVEPWREHFSFTYKCLSSK
ncbi:hypothetical protein niasHT_015638 [Heterodera trifolii]|uniref:Uncharacterized protein n=1 Tax=Heterodera trifolii TaxID=157864 RepID=A0ABD2L5I5_9BILA